MGSNPVRMLTVMSAKHVVNTPMSCNCTPRKFDIVEYTDCSITFEWFIDVQDECLSYELDHRPPHGTDNLPVTTFSSKDLNALIIDVQDECLSYELHHRPPQGINNLSVRTFSSKDVVEGGNGRRMYTLQNLLPETCYEFKLRSVYKDAKSHYSQSKTKQTLKLENEPNKEMQDQTSVKTNLPVSVTLRQQLNIKNSKNQNPMISSCIKIGNTLVFDDYLNEQLIICNSDGSDIDHISLSYEPRYITEIDSNTVAVSCIDCIILIINISTRSVTSTISKTRDNCWGISYNDTNLYVIIDKRTIHVIDLTGKVIRTIRVPPSLINDITVDRDRLVCKNNSTIYCCSLEGKLMWKFKKVKFRDLRGVTTDNEGNVYVTNAMTHTVIVVSDDGKHHRELLTESDGLNKPLGIYFNKKENTLLVCNYEGKSNVFLFDVKHKLT
ncbi:uncharacterized protein [Mytilus edulis]|uniref:uncharacterized protein n=1 Tax=Mytilus edulis TaxID=6550 RepID=UPI0039EEF842